MPDQAYELYKFKHFLDDLQTFIPGYEFFMHIDEVKNVIVIKMTRQTDGKEATVELDRTQQYYSDEIVAECLFAIEKLEEETTNERES